MDSESHMNGTNGTNGTNGMNGTKPTKPKWHQFTSESVGEGHPDKICDQVSDAVLDACLAVDPLSKVACECAAKTGMIMLLGEITTKAHPDFQKIVRDTIKGIGYDDSSKGFDYKTCNVMQCLEQQSPDIAQGLKLDEALEKLGAGDQGIMFGYATDETPEYLPLTVQLAHKLNKEMSTARNNGSLPWLRPDTKTQVTIEWEDDNGAVIPRRVHTVVVSAQHSPDISTEKLREEIKEKIIKKAIPAEYLDEQTLYHVGTLNIPKWNFLTVYRSNHRVYSSSVDRKEMLVLRVVRSLSIHTGAGVPMEAAPSPAKITRRLTDLVHTLRGGLQNRWCTQSWHAAY